MIAASDPQEFIPSGRQQAIKHPGPLELGSYITPVDNILLDKLERVSLTDPKDEEKWVLRRATNNRISQIKLYHKKSGTLEHKLYGSYNSTRSHSEIFEDSKSLKSIDITNKIRRTSNLDASRFPNRISSSSDVSKSNLFLNKSVVADHSVNEPIEFRTKIDIDYMEEELYMKGNTVIWSHGLVNSFDNSDDSRKNICSYTSSLPIKHAIWCTFYSERPMYDSNIMGLNKCENSDREPVPSVCIVDSESIKVFTKKGEDFVMALPFQIGSIWNTKFGIFFERDTTENTGNISHRKGSLYSLAYPLDDLCPVAINQSSQMNLLNNSKLKVVYTSENPSICMIYDCENKQHYVYRIRRSKYGEKLDLCEKSVGCSTSAASSSTKLRSRLSMWENVKNRSSTAVPSPAGSRSGSYTSIWNVQHSKSLSSMATMSRCQSPAASSSSTPWLARASRMNNSPLCIENYASQSNCSFFDYSKSMLHLQTLPMICLDCVWTESSSTLDGSDFGPASKVFLCDDFTGQWYFCFIIEVTFKLFMVKIDFVNARNITFGMLTSISARDAVPLPLLHMLAILEYNGNVMLYSGLTSVGKLHIGGTLVCHTPSPFVRRNLPQFTSPFPRRSSLLPHSGQHDPKFEEHLLSPVLHVSNAPNKNTNILQMSFSPEGHGQLSSILTGLRDALENRLTLQYFDGSCYRIALPYLATSPLVENCLNTFRQCLQRDALLTLFTRWYSTRNSFGTQKLTNKQEWEMFTSLIYELLGYEDAQVYELSKECPVTPSNTAKRAKHSNIGTDEDWLYLIGSEHYNNVVENKINNLLHLPFMTSKLHITAHTSSVKLNTNSVLFPYIKFIHYALHMLYEDFKLNILKHELLQLLAMFLCKLSNDLGLIEYSLHYWTDFPEHCTVNNACYIPPKDLKNVNTFNVDYTKPINVMEHISNLMKRKNPTPYPYLQHVNSRSKDIIQLCGILSNEANEFISIDQLVKTVEPSQTNDNIDCTEYANLVSGSTAEEVVILMTQMKITTKVLDTFPFGVYLYLYSALWKCRENPPSDWPAEAYFLIWREDLAKQTMKRDHEKTERTTNKYGMYSSSQLEEISPNMKPCDLESPDGMEDIDYPLLKLRFPDDIRIAETRKMLQSSKPVPITLVQRPDISDHDFIEEQEKHLYAICTRTMALPVGRGMFTLRTSTPVITEPLPNPQLCLIGKAAPRGTTVELTHIDTPTNMSLWPLFHNGVANGLRISPDVYNIDNTWIIFNKPKTPDKQMEHGGFLMALGLHGHLKNLDMWRTYDYLSKNDEMISVGILLGLSSAFRGTCHSEVTRILSIHVEALLPPTSMELDVPQTLQVAALLGVGMLYEGTAHRHMTEVLLSEIGRPPGPEMENSADRESYSLAAGLALGLVTLRHGGKRSGLSDLNVPDILHYYMVGGNRRPLIGAQRDKYKVSSFQIREGHSVNLDITSPGATLALGLMYLGTGNKAVADWMSSPETLYLLDFIRPDFLMLRILSKALILWEDIEPSKEWIENQVPANIRPYCMVQPSTSMDIDYEAMNQAYCNIITGGCFAMGLRYAGSGNEDAFKTLLHFCHMFTSLTGKSIAELAGKPTIETCLNVLLLSVSMVMAGTGNLEIMRLIRHLRRRVGVSSSAVVTYGSHLAIHMALGLLYLGGGRYTLSNTPSSVAALICAFYPKFPTHSNDNRYHLQAFRHLYVLAAEPRLIIPRDVHLSKSCYANLKITKFDGTEVSLRGPCLLPDLNTVLEIAIEDDRYWPILFKRGQNWDLLSKILSTTGYIEVKQRAGCLSYITDKFGYHSQLARTLTQSTIAPWDPSSTSIIAFTSEQAVRYFCDNFLGTDDATCQASELHIKQLFTKIMYDAVVADKLIIIPTFTAIIKMIGDLRTNPSSIQMWQFKLVFNQATTNAYAYNLIANEVVLSLAQEVSYILENWEEELLSSLRNYVAKGIPNTDKHLFKKLSTYITFYDIPHNLEVKTSSSLDVITQLQSDCSSKVINKLLKILNIRM